MENLTLHEKLSIANLNDEEKKAYIEFIKALVKMARDTKKAFKLNPDLSLSDIPHLIMLDKFDKYISIFFSVANNSWIISSKEMEKTKFNPTAITGVIMFLNDFKTDIIMSAIDNLYNQITQLLNKIDEQPNT
jgi:hypothetical protein